MRLLFVFLVACTSASVSPRGSVPDLTLVSLERSVLQAGQQTTLTFSSDRAGAYGVTISPPQGKPRVLVRGAVQPATNVGVVITAADLGIGANQVAVVVRAADGQVAPLTLTLTLSAGATASSGSFTVGGTAAGLYGKGVALQLESTGNTPQTLNVTTSPFVFATSLASGTPYTVKLLNGTTTEPAQTCTLTGGASGTIANSNVSTVVLTCSDRAPRETPRLFFTDLQAAPVGAFVTLYGEELGLTTDSTPPVVSVGGVDVPAFRFQVDAGARTLDKLTIQLDASVPVGVQQMVVKRWGRSPSGTVAINVKTTGQIYYVAPSGNDADTGSVSAPWQTLRHALPAMQSNDIAYLRAGTYSAGPDACVGDNAAALCVLDTQSNIAIVGYPEASGTATITSTTAQTAVINGSGITVANLDIAAPAVAGSYLTGAGTRATGTADLRLIGNRFATFSLGIGSPQLLLKAADRAAILGNKFAINDGAAHAYIDSSSGDVVGCDVGFNEFGGTPADLTSNGLTLQGDGTRQATDVSVHHNRFSQHYKAVWMQDCFAAFCLLPGGFDDLAIFNNLFLDAATTTYREVIYLGFTDAHLCVAHNTAVQNGSATFLKVDNLGPSGATGSVVHIDANVTKSAEALMTIYPEHGTAQTLANYATFDRNVFNGLNVAQPSGVTLTSTNLIAASPTFTPGTQVLTVASAGANAGTGVVCAGQIVVADDYFGYPRDPLTPDLGAFETIQ